MLARGQLHGVPASRHRRITYLTTHYPLLDKHAATVHKASKYGEREVHFVSVYICAQIRVVLFVLKAEHNKTTYQSS